MTPLSEVEFMRLLAIEICSIPGVRVWRQNSGAITFRDPGSKRTRTFHAGPPAGAADLSGIVGSEGYRLEIEVKGALTRATHQQRRWGDFICASGGIHVLVRYDAQLSPADNLERGRMLIEAAIARRCGRVGIALRIEEIIPRAPTRAPRPAREEGRCPS